MINLLSRIFIKDYKNYKNAEVRYKYGILCGIFGVFLNVVLFAAKYFAGVISNSIAIMADSFNNLSDAGSSVITLIGFKLAKSKPDSKHPFGHGRMEYLSGLVVSFLIILMGFELAKSSIEKILNPTDIETGIVPMLVLAVSILIKLYMSFYNRNIGKKIDSGAMQATASDSLSDSIATFAVMLSMIISHFAGINVDGICGCIVSVLIMYAGINSVRDTISPLLGQKPDPELVANIERTVLANENVIGVHDMVVHDYGPGRIMVSLHAEVDGKGDIFVLHDAIDLIENRLHDEFGCEAVIHMDPIVTDDEETNSTKLRVIGILREYSSSIHIHDFRMVKGPTHTNVIFDAVVPFEFNGSDKEVKTAIECVISQSLENTNAVVKIDRGYV